MEDLIITTLLEIPYVWNYDPPLNLIAYFAMGVGLFLQIVLMRKRIKFFLLPLLWLAVSLTCEYLYQTIRGFEAFGPAIFGLMTYLALFGSLIGILVYKFWTKVRH